MRVEVIVCHILVYWFYLFLSFVLIGCTRPRRTVWNKWRSWKSSMCHKRRCLVPRENRVHTEVSFSAQKDKETFI